MKVNRRDVAKIVEATFPDYKGRKFNVKPTEAVRFSDLNWSGGTCNKYRACGLDGRGITARVNLNEPPPWANPFEGKQIELPEGVVIVAHSFFCGKDCGLTIYVNPANMPRLLGPATVQTSPALSA